MPGLMVKSLRSPSLLRNTSKTRLIPSVGIEIKHAPEKILTLHFLGIKKTGMAKAHESKNIAQPFVAFEEIASRNPGNPDCRHLCGWQTPAPG